MQLFTWHKILKLFCSGSGLFSSAVLVKHAYVVDTLTTFKVILEGRRNHTCLVAVTMVPEDGTEEVCSTS